MTWSNVASMVGHRFEAKEHQTDKSNRAKSWVTVKVEVTAIIRIMVAEIRVVINMEAEMGSGVSNSIAINIRVSINK